MILLSFDIIKIGGENMTDRLEKDWKIFLIEIGKTEREVAEECGYFPANLNRRIKSQSIKYVDLSEIVERYGYSISIHKKEE